MQAIDINPVQYIYLYSPSVVTDDLVAQEVRASAPLVST